jgi:hypothetical protein
VTLRVISPEQATAVLAEAGMRVGTASLDGAARPPTLEVIDYTDLVAQVKAAERTPWLIEGLWPGDAYGVLGAEDKAGKTFAVIDLSVAVATGGRFLGHFRCPDPGPVLAFFGEGGKRLTRRRVSAVLQACGGKDADLTGRLRVCHRAPRLTSREHLEAIRHELAEHPARLVVIDPLYLAAAGAKGADLYAMGELLSAVQIVCQDAGAALVVSTHWNKTGPGTGATRFTGVGPGAWGRVLASAAVESRAAEPDGASSVLLRWEFSGSEIAEQSFRMHRRVRAEDPHDLDSRLFYECEVTDLDGRVWSARDRILAVLPYDQTAACTTRDIGDSVAADGMGRR